MKVHFTKKEYRQLLDLVFLGETMATGHIEGNFESPYQEITNKIYGLAKNFGYEELADCNKHTGECHESAVLEESLFEVMFRHYDYIKSLD